MKITHSVIAALILASAGISTAHAAYDAYEDLSDTHARNTAQMQAGLLEESGATEKNNLSFFNINQPYEDFMETRFIASASQPGARGRIGFEGKTGQAGSASAVLSRFDLPSDVANGCSRYLRCSGE